jgi:hypothetical protein
MAKHKRQSDPTVNIKRETVPSEQFVSLYVNDTQVQMSPWDFRLMFGVIEGVPSPEDPTIRVKQIGEVRMSPAHTKRIAQVLMKQIASYEEKIGHIALVEE